MGVFQFDWTSGHAMRLNSRTGTEGPPVSALNCDGPLHSGLKAPRRSAWLIVHAQVKVSSRDTCSPSRASKTNGHNAFQIIHIHTTVITSGRARTILNTGQTAGMAPDIILADAAVTPPSPK